MKNPFLTNLRYLADGTRLYGREQPGQTLGLFVLSLYLPMLLPLASSGVWTELDNWLAHVWVPSPGLVLAVYGVLVAIVIALALAAPPPHRLAYRAPYPVERPMKARLISNIRLFIIIMLGLNSVGVIFTEGMERFEHLVCLALGALLLQLGHLDEVNAVQVEPVLEQLGDDPLARYDRWYASRWGVRPQAEANIARPQILRWHFSALTLISLLHVAALLGYILLVHGASGVVQHLPIVLFLCLTSGYVSVRVVEAKMHAIMLYRHNYGSRFESRFSHPETFVAYLLILTKLATAAAMAVLPLMWLNPTNSLYSVAYLGWLLVELLCLGGVLVALMARWGGRKTAPIQPLTGYDRDYMRYLRRKHAAKQRASIRGAVKYAAQHHTA